MSETPTKETSGRVLAIDYGEKRIGLAVCDISRQVVRGLPTLEQKPAKQDPKRVFCIPAILNHLQELQVSEIVMGLPVNMDGSEGPSAQRVLAFTEQLAEQTPLPITLLDERLTSFIAEERLKEQGKSPSRNKHLVDQEAACLILEDFLRGE
jgi:putative holliday junction resolvase